jgi:hypothetical protein
MPTGQAGMTAIQDTAEKMIGGQPHQAKSRPRKPSSYQATDAGRARTMQMRRTNIGDERIAWRTADALADTVDEAHCDPPPSRRRGRKDRLCECCQSITDTGQKFAITEPVTQCSRKDYFCDRSGSFGDAFDDAWL